MMPLTDDTKLRFRGLHIVTDSPKSMENLKRMYKSSGQNFLKQELQQKVFVSDDTGLLMITLLAYLEMWK